MESYGPLENSNDPYAHLKEVVEEGTAARIDQEKDEEFLYALLEKKRKEKEDRTDRLRELGAEIEEAVEKLRH